MSDFLPGLEVEEAPPPPKLSAGVRRTAKQREQIARGIHPATGLPLLPLLSTPEERQERPTCGSCVFLIGKHYDRTYWKCRRALTNGQGPDIRTTWPACTLFELNEDERDVRAMA